MKKIKSSLALSTLLILFAPIGASAAFSAPDALNCQVMPQLMKAYLSHHVHSHELSPELKARTVDTYLKWIDSSKALFLDSEAQTLKKELISGFDQILRGNCSILSRVNADVIKRSKAMEDAIRKYVDRKDYKLDESAELILNPDKRGFPKTVQDRDNLYVNQIHFQISTYITSGTPLADAKKQLVHRYELLTKRASEMKEDDIFSTFMEAYAASLDPHSSYLSADVLEDFQISMNLSLEGIGVSLSTKDGYTVVEDIVPGGAADRMPQKDQLKPKDKIVAVSEPGKTPTQVIDMQLRDVVRLIRGKKGTKVTLTILRQEGSTKQFNVSIVRDKIDLTEQAAKIRYETREIDGQKLKLGVLDLPSFYGDSDKKTRDCYRDVKKLLEQASKEKVDGIVLDLSRNGGGLLNHAVGISGLFLKTGGMVAVQDSKKKVEVLEDDDSNIQYSGPMVILTSRLSASASEILAGAMKDYSRALIVGDDHTYGKGTVQAVLPLPPGLGAIKVTTGIFFRPGGESTQKTGVTADITLPSYTASDEIGESEVPNAIGPQKIPAYLATDINSNDPASHWVPISKDLVSELATASRARVEKSTEFAEVKKKVDEIKKRKEVVKLADFKKQSTEEEEKEKAKPARSKKKGLGKHGDKEDSPQLKEAINILADLVQLEKKKTLLIAKPNAAGKSATTEENNKH